MSLHPEDKTATEKDLEDVTINPVFMGAEYNDLGFSVGDRLVTLVESQSTWSVNIIIRAFLYLANTYNDYFTRTGQNLYTSKKASVPTPEVYVIYTGDKKEVPECISFKEEFIQNGDCAIDVNIKILNSKYDKSIIGQYIMFCKVYDEQRRIYGRTKKAIEETIGICLDKDILTEYLKEHEREVETIMLALFDEKYLSRAYETTLREKLTEEITAKVQRETAQRVERETAQRVERETAQRVERETAQRVERETAQRVERETAQRVERETAQKEARQFALRLLKLGDMSAEKIAKLTNLSVEEVKELSKTK